MTTTKSSPRANNIRWTKTRSVGFLNPRPKPEKSEFDPWKLIKRRNVDNPYCLALRYRSSIYPTGARRPRTTTPGMVHRRRRKRTDSAVTSDSDGRSSQMSLLNDLQELDNFFKEDYDFDGEEPQEPPLYPHLVHTPGTYIQELYLKACRRLQIPHSSSFYKNLTGETIVLKRQHLGPIGMKACAIALLETLDVQTLDLTDNNLGPEGARYIAELISENQFIKHLNLSSNCLGYDGVHVLAEAIKKTDSIVTLNISGNEIGDRHAEAVRPIIEDTNSLTHLYLSHNNLGDQGAATIGSALIWSDTIKHLDLSWNHLREKGAVKLAESLLKNTSITSLNLSYNGMYVRGLSAMARVLEKNAVLTELDVSNNRLDRTCLDTLCASLKKNNTLQVLRIGHNPLTPEDVVTMVTFVQEMTSSGLKYIDLSGVSVEDSFVSLVDELRAERGVTVVHGILLGKDMVIHDIDEGRLLQEESWSVLDELSHVLGVNIENMFRGISEQLHTCFTTEQIVNGLKILQNPLSDRCTEILLKRMESDKTGLIDFSHRKKSDKPKEAAFLVRRMSFMEVMREEKEGEEEADKTDETTDNDDEEKEEVDEDIAERIRRCLFRVMTRRMCGSTVYKRNVENMGQDGETMLKYRIIEQLLDSREDRRTDKQKQNNAPTRDRLK